MGFKRVKLLSGMLSAAAIASMAGMPVLAGETAEEGLSLAFTGLYGSGRTGFCLRRYGRRCFCTEY